MSQPWEPTAPVRPNRADAVLCRLDEAKRCMRRAERRARAGDWAGAELQSSMASLSARMAEHLSMPGYVVEHTDVVVVTKPSEPLGGGYTVLQHEGGSRMGDMAALRRGLRERFGI